MKCVRVCLLICSIALVVNNSYAANIVDTLYINRGVFTTVNGNTFPFLAYDTTIAFSAQTKVFQLTTSDILQLTVINNDTIEHGFRVDEVNQQLDLAPGVNGTLNLQFNVRGVYSFYDQVTSPTNRYLGLSGMFAVDNSDAKKYYWHLREHEKQYNIELADGQAVNWLNYTPDYFTINGWSFPDLQLDSSAAITANVGDTIHIFIFNAGVSFHSIHFHGFHCEVLQSISNTQNGRVKDTSPFKPMEGMMLELIPDKPSQATFRNV